MAVPVPVAVWQTLFEEHMLNARFTGEILGHGSYGVVEKVDVNGEVCAGKSIHEYLLKGADYDRVIEKYRKECLLMKCFDHPNIIKFLGVCAMPECDKLPVLVMRKLDGNLNDLLNGYRDPNLPLSLKLSVVSDVAKGLQYLHNFNAEEKIIHGDLTVRNVLLTSRMVAQITDFGVSSIVDKREVLTLSAKPGALAYMPPEAIEIVPAHYRPRESAHYGPSLDIFSFGHLSLVTLTQNTTGELLHFNALQDGNRVRRSEVERRAGFFEQLEATPENIPQLQNLVVECLADKLNSRPSSEQVVEQLESIKRDNKVGTPCSVDIQRAASILKEGEKNRTIKKTNRSTRDMKMSYLSILAVFGALLIFMANSGFLIHMILQYPFLFIMASGVIIYSIMYLSDLIFYNNSRLYNKSHFFWFLALYVAVMAGVFAYFIPLLKMNEVRIIFRPNENCNMFENPPKYICYIRGTEKCYTTIRRGCDETATNATSFYIISLWIPSKRQYKLKERVYFHPDNITDTEPKPPYWLPVNYCIQEFIEDHSPSTDDQLRVSFVSWNTTTFENTADTGYINRSDLEEYHTGWYIVSNCMWEMMRLLPFDYCITGYVSNHYVDLPDYIARLLHDEEVLAKHASG